MKIENLILTTALMTTPALAHADAPREIYDVTRAEIGVCANFQGESRGMEQFLDKTRDQFESIEGFDEFVRAGDIIPAICARTYFHGGAENLELFIEGAFWGPWGSFQDEEHQQFEVAGYTGELDSTLSQEINFYGKLGIGLSYRNRGEGTWRVGYQVDGSMGLAYLSSHGELGFEITPESQEGLNDQFGDRKTRANFPDGSQIYDILEGEADGEGWGPYAQARVALEVGIGDFYLQLGLTGGAEQQVLEMVTKTRYNRDNAHKLKDEKDVVSYGRFTWGPDLKLGLDF